MHITGSDHKTKGKISLNFFQFLINNNLRSNIDKVRKEAARDLGILYRTRPNFNIINALKETVR